LFPTLAWQFSRRRAMTARQANVRLISNRYGCDMRNITNAKSTMPRNWSIYICLLDPEKERKGKLR
jgi:hypothetical protein